MLSEWSNAKTEEILARELTVACEPECPTKVIKSIAQLNIDRIRLLDSSIPRGLDVVLAPITGPVSAWHLSRVRAGSSEM